MSWHDDSDADEYGELRAARPKGPAAWSKLAGRVAGYAGLVVGVVALAVGAVIAVNALGVAAKPGGFGVPLADAPSVPLPPMVAPLELGDDAGSPSEDPEEHAAAGTQEVPMPLVDPEWTSQVAEATGIPARALSAYTLAHVTIADEQPECGLDWATVAAIGEIESGHGSHADAVLEENGNAYPAIIGRALDGDGVARIEDTDGGILDGDETWDRAVGPMQFIPSTWFEWASDANGDDVADPNQIDDAALTAARYLCASGPMTSADDWRAAVFSYNHDNDYVDKVAKVALEYAASAG